MAVGLVVVAGAFLALAGCNGTGSVSSAGPTPVDIARVSLVPASDAPAPDAPAAEMLASAVALPPDSLPSGEPSANPVTVDYVLGADDLAGFIGAYRAAFPGVEMDDGAIENAGARLCTYLARHVDADGSVAVGEVLAESEINEPGYAQKDWFAAFEVATSHYCREFTVDR